MRRIWIVFLICYAITSCTSVKAFFSGEAGNWSNVSYSDDEMNRAIQQAQATLPLFISALQAPTSTQTSFLIKAGFSYDENSTEHMWISDISLKNNQFEGMLANEPIYVKNLRLGNYVAVQFDDVSDWQIIDTGRLVGGFTIYVLRSRMSESERRQFDSESGLIFSDSPLLP
jgi:uncharacterized protein YegJ (DUF2314 family)